MKNTLLLIVITAAFLLSGCKEEGLLDIETSIDQPAEVTALPDPALQDENRSVDPDEAPFEPLAISDDYPNSQLKMPVEIAKNQVELRSSCSPHYDYPVFYGRLRNQLIVQNRTICRDGEKALGGIIRTNQLGSTYWDNMIGLKEKNTVADNRGMYLAYSREGKVQVGSIDRYGYRREHQNYTWVDYWTDLVSLEDRMFLFYSRANNAVYIGYITAGGAFRYLNFFWWTDWTHIVHLGNNKVLTYNQESGKLHVVQVGSNGSWKILKKTKIRTGFTHILPLGRQSKVENGVCCFDYGQGFMGYSSHRRDNYIYVVKKRNSVELRKYYDSSSWQFHNLTQLQGGKFIANFRGGEPQSSKFYIGNIDEMGNWRWESYFNLDYDLYNPIFTMHFE